MDLFPAVQAQVPGHNGLGIRYGATGIDFDYHKSSFTEAVGARLAASLRLMAEWELNR